MEATVFIICEISFATCAILKFGEYSRIFVSFCWGIFPHVTRLDQASENIWWIIKKNIRCFILPFNQPCQELITVMGSWPCHFTGFLARQSATKWSTLVLSVAVVHSVSTNDYVFEHGKHVPCFDVFPKFIPGNPFVKVEKRLHQPILPKK